MKTSKKVLSKAIKLFGITETCADGGFLLHDGRLLDFKSSKGLKFIHDAIAKVYGKNQKSPVSRFMKETKSIRYYPMQNTTHLEIQAENGINNKQASVLQKCICQQALRPHRIIYDVIDDGTIVESGEVAENPYRDAPCRFLISKFMNKMLKYGDENV